MLKVHCWRLDFFLYFFIFCYICTKCLSLHIFSVVPLVLQSHMCSIVQIGVPSIFSESPGHCPSLHSSSRLHRVPSRLEPEDSPPLHLPTLAVMGRAPQSPGRSSGAQPALQSSVSHSTTQSTGWVTSVIITHDVTAIIPLFWRRSFLLRSVMLSRNSSKATHPLSESSLYPFRIPGPARSFVVPSSRVWCTGSTPPCPGSLSSPGSTLRGTLLGRAPHGHKTQRCSTVSWVNGELTNHGVDVNVES